MRIRNFPLPVTRYPLSENGQIVIFLVFLLAVLLSFMGGIITVGNKSLKNLRMQNAADAAALAGTACLARGLNSMAGLAASKINPKAEEGEKKSLIYRDPWEAEHNEDNPAFEVSPVGTTYAPVEIFLQDTGETASSSHTDKRLYFDALRNRNINDNSRNVINEGDGDPDEDKVAALSEEAIKGDGGVINAHFKLINDAIEETKREYVGGGGFNAKIEEMSERFAYENGYAFDDISSIEEGSTQEKGWQPEWKEEDAKTVKIKYTYWEEPPTSKRTINMGCPGPSCSACYNRCNPCGVRNTARTTCNCSPLGGCSHGCICYCKKCWQKEEGVEEDSSQNFWIGGNTQSTEVSVSVKSADGTTRTAKGEITNKRSDSNPDGGRLFPPSANFEIQLKE